MIDGAVVMALFADLSEAKDSIAAPHDRPDRDIPEINMDDMAWILKEPVVTHARSVVDDNIKKMQNFSTRQAYQQRSKGIQLQNAVIGVRI